MIHTFKIIVIEVFIKALRIDSIDNYRLYSKGLNLTLNK